MRTLVLKKETLAELAATDLRSVVGAGSGAVCVQATVPASYCLRDVLSDLNCYSWHTEQC